MSGVSPSLSFASLLAPTEIRYLTTSSLPLDDAQNRAVKSCLLLIYLSQPHSMRDLTSLRFPCEDA